MAMKRCPHTPEIAFDYASLSLLGLLEEQERTAFEQHQHECDECSREFARARDVIASLSFTCRPETPRPELKGRILASVSANPAQPQVWKSWGGERDPSVQVVRRQEGEWQTVHPGIHVKQLSADHLRDSVSMLIRMDPGSRYIPHRHGGPEQCFVLEGDLREDDLVLAAGDFQYASEGSTHGAQWTENGCLLLIVCSQTDELLI